MNKVTYKIYRLGDFNKALKIRYKLDELGIESSVTGCLLNVRLVNEKEKFELSDILEYSGFVAELLNIYNLNK